MSAPEPIVALVLAAGLSRRYGSDKLIADFQGKPLGAHIAETLVSIALDHRIAVCPADNPARIELFTERSFEIVINREPESGLGSSLALGARRATELGARRLLVCLADMPLVSAEHLMSLLLAADQYEIVATDAGGIRMPPAVFPRDRLHALATLTGDAGARSLLRTARAVEMPAREARDIDAPGDA